MVKRFGFFLAVLLAVWLAEPAWTRDVYHGIVGRVLDGDTFELVEGSRFEDRKLVTIPPVKVRLLFIDAPESKQEYGPEAREMLKGLLGEQVIVLSPGKDRYGRLLGEVINEQTFQNVNTMMLFQGCAWQYMDHDFRRRYMQELAKQAGRGLWKNPDALEPWKFRRK